MENLDEDVNTYICYSELLNEIINEEKDLFKKKRDLEELRSQIVEGDGGFGIDMSDHAFKQILERLEVLAFESDIIFKDIFSPDSLNDSLLLASNIKSFIITTIAKARKDNKFIKAPSKSGGSEFKFTVDVKKWSDDKRSLQFVCIVENNVIKTGYFNWV
jgi:frataxin-like iron-binding protein CyaY